MQLVIDSNIVFSAILNSHSNIGQIILNGSKHFAFLTTTFLMEEIDLLVELEKPIGWKFFTLQIYLENILGRKIDLVTKNALKKQLKDRILEQVQIRYLPK